MITWTDVTNIAPELTSSPVGTQNAILAFVNSEVSPEAFGGEGIRADTARAYFAAHMATLSARGDTHSGPLTSESEGGVSASFGFNSPLGTDPLFDKTSYGQFFRLLARNSLGRLPCVV